MNNKFTQKKDIPLLDCPTDFLIGDASGKIMNEYGLFPCKIKCGTYALLVRGTAKATLNITEYNFRQNDLIYMQQGTFLRIHEFSEDALVYYIIFSSAFLEKYTYNSRISLSALQQHSPFIHLNDDIADAFKHAIDTMLKALNTTPPMLNTEQMVLVHNQLQLFYYNAAKETTQLTDKQPQDRRTEIFRDYKNLVLNNYQKWHHVADYANAMRLSVPHLCSTIKAISGKTAGDIINEAILTDAKAQLKLTTAPIKEISYSLGFDNVAFFNRFFKTHTNSTPKEYRNN